MIHLKQDLLTFSFPHVHGDAAMELEFQRTLRIPDDDTIYPLPPGLGNFPIHHIDDFESHIPKQWKEHGGVMFPMFQSEAMWINFNSPSRYPFLVKIATGQINAVTGGAWQDRPQSDPQDYVVVPDQPWLDGYCVKKGEIRQFVAMPLGHGYTTEEQLTGEAVHGGIQVIVHPMKAEEWEKIKTKHVESDIKYCSKSVFSTCEPDMGLAPGGRMTQKVYDDLYDFNVWDLDHGSRCFVHITNSITWRAITGEAPPTIPLTSRQYTEAGLPWFNYYAPENEAVDGGRILKKLRSVSKMSAETGEAILPENDTIAVPEAQLFKLGNLDQVREGW